MARPDVSDNDDQIDPKNCEHPSSMDVTKAIGNGERIVVTSICKRCGADC